MNKIFKKKLILHRETLRSLVGRELLNVAGGSRRTCDTCIATCEGTGFPSECATCDSCFASACETNCEC